MRTILLIAYYYPPLATSGAMRPLAFSRFLPEFGWAPTVLTTDAASAPAEIQIDAELMVRVPSSVRVLRAPYASPVGRLVEMRNAMRCLLFPSRPVEANSRSPVASSAEQRRPRFHDHIVERLWGFPDVCAPWQRPALRASKRAFPRNAPDAVFATAPPWTTLVLGHRLASLFGAPLIVDFRDPWTTNPVRRTLSGWAEAKASTLEAKIVRSAALIVANTEESRQRLADRYPHAAPRVRTITNGYDPDVMTPKPSASIPTTRVELCHFGTVYGQRSPRPLLLALKTLNELAAGTLSSRLLVRFIGDWEAENEATEALALELEREGLIRREAPLPHAACLQAMGQAGMLLVLQASSPVQIPGKLYEYIAMGRPILLVGGEGATMALIERHQLGLFTRNRHEDIVGTLKTIVEHPRQLPTPSPMNIAQFDYRTLTRRLAQELDAICRPEAGGPDRTAVALTHSA